MHQETLIEKSKDCANERKSQWNPSDREPAPTVAPGQRVGQMDLGCTATYARWALRCLELTCLLGVVLSAKSNDFVQ